MSKVGPRPVNAFVRRKPARKIIIASGDSVRTIVLRPWLTATLATVGLAFFALYLAATGYLVFRDDLLAASIARQARIQHAYEDRIATLRADIDRLTSRQLLNQQQVEADMARLIDRQTALDARQDVIAALSQAARRVGITAAPPASEAAAPAATEPPAKRAPPSPLADAAIRTGTPVDKPTAGPLARIGSLQESLDLLAREQAAYVDTIADRVARRSQKIAGVLGRLGQKVPASRAGRAESGVGGPFVAIAPSSDPAAFRSAVALITDELERFGALRRLAGSLPLGKPVPNTPITSRFGPRMDPFLGQPAMHTGIDFRAAAGYPARVTADGTVVTAGYTGGYGNMVEVDHGNGITTRYGHLSKIDAKVGQVVSRGTIIGRAGSTGRSTGPHLHYEVRVDGSPIDPIRYIKAGSEIASLL